MIAVSRRLFLAGSAALAAPALMGRAVALDVPNVLVQDVTLNIPGDYPTLQAAVDEWSTVRVRNGVRIILNIQAGHELTGALTVKNANFGYFVITSEDSVVRLAPGFEHVHEHRAVMLVENARAPVWDTVVNGEGQIGRALMYVAVSQGIINRGKGAVGVNWYGPEDMGAAIYVENSHIKAKGAVATDSNRGIWVTRGAGADVEEAVFDRSRFIGVYASRGANVAAANCSAQYCGVGISCHRSMVSADHSNVSHADRGYVAHSNGHIDAFRGKATNCTGDAVSSWTASIVNAREVDATESGKYGFSVWNLGQITRTGATGTNSQPVNRWTKRGLIIDDAGPEIPLNP